MANILKVIAGKLPEKYQQELKRLYFSRKIKKGSFVVTGEREFELLDQWIERGDWVLDIGANIGHYSARFSGLVGATGRVIAFEPVPKTFELLAANTCKLPCENISLMNIAASSTAKTVGIEIPSFETGLKNYYEANLSKSGSLQILALPIDSLNLPNKIKLVKIDAEGHELEVLQGMAKLLKRDRPRLIVEDNSPKATEYLFELGFVSEKLKDSPNVIFVFP